MLAAKELHKMFFIFLDVYFLISFISNLHL